MSDCGKHSNVLGIDPGREVDLILVNSPLRDYDSAPRLRKFSLPVLGISYIATVAQQMGFNVGVLDSEALGIGISGTASLVNKFSPRWIGLNLLSPTFKNSIAILNCIEPSIRVMLGGHHAKALPERIVQNCAIPRVDALVVGEAELRVARLLEDIHSRSKLPQIYWRGIKGGIKKSEYVDTDYNDKLISPDVDELPILDRKFLANDPFVNERCQIESIMIGSRGCNYNCAFCGAARGCGISVAVRHRISKGIIEEMLQLNSLFGVQHYRFVDDLFLNSSAFVEDWCQKLRKMRLRGTIGWEATGRINILGQLSDRLLAKMANNGCRELAIGIESGSNRVLRYMGKSLCKNQIIRTVSSLLRNGINVKGYFIFGYPTETRAELNETIKLIKSLWKLSDLFSGTFRCSVFEFRPYPGTVEWKRLIKAGYAAKHLMTYKKLDFPWNRPPIDNRIANNRDDYNFTVNLKFSEVPPAEVQKIVEEIMHMQHLRNIINIPLKSTDSTEALAMTDKTISHEVKRADLCLS